MNPAAATKGQSFAGVVAYITHDIGKSSDDRVEYTHTLNMRTDDPEKAAKVMAWTAINAAQLKEAAGIKATGRKTKDPVYHFSLNWEPGQKPSHDHMVETAKSALAVLGFEGHEAVFAVHTDKAHKHMHIVVNRVNPETGRTHGKQFEFNLLQAWAYQYERAQGRVVCLERAIKYEKDESLKAEYMKRLTAEIESGKVRDSKPRPQWEAEKEAPFPKSKTALEIKADIRARVKALAKAGRDIAARHSKDWDELKIRHKAEKLALDAKQREAFKNRRRFNQASGVEPYSWKSYQADRAVLKKQHLAATQKLRAELKDKDAPEVDRFKAGQKAAWREFFRLEKAADRGQLDRVLKVVASTSVGVQGPEYRDHLARLFNATVDAGTRKVEFGKLLDTQKREFFKGLTLKNAPVLAAHKGGQDAQLVGLRQRFDQAREAQKFRSASITTSREATAEERRQLHSRQQSERAATKARHATDTEGQQQAWAELNKTRSAVWDNYKAMRARQAGSVKRGKDAGLSPASDLDRGTLTDYANSRSVQGRDYGREGEAGPTPGDTGRGITRKGPSGT